MSKVYEGGIPVDVDVKKITEEFGVPEKGDFISYDVIADLIGYHRKTSRFISVTNKWRKLLFDEYNLVVEAVRNEGFHILDDNQRVDHVTRGIARNARGLGKTHRKSVTTPQDDLTPEKRRVLDHQNLLLASLLTTGRDIEKSRAVVPGSTRLWGGLLEASSEGEK